MSYKQCAPRRTVDISTIEEYAEKSEHRRGLSVPSNLEISQERQKVSISRMAEVREAHPGFAMSTHNDNSVSCVKCGHNNPWPTKGTLVNQDVEGVSRRGSLGTCGGCGESLVYLRLPTWFGFQKTISKVTRVYAGPYVVRGAAVKKPAKPLVMAATA